jgi:hypothetical protein
MKNTLLFNLFILLSSFAFVQKLNAQLLVDAGNDKVVCMGIVGIADTNRIGGTPTATGGIAPYRYEWSTSRKEGITIFTAKDLLIDTTVSNPVFRIGFGDIKTIVPIKFFVKVTDANQNVRFDSVSVRLSSFLVLGRGIKPLTYRWTPNYNISDTAYGAPIVWPRRSTIYSCQVKDSAGCVSSGFILEWAISVITNTKDINNLLKVSIYPNPIVSASQLSIDVENHDDKTLFIYNSVGQMIYGQKITASKIPIGQFIKDNGTYFYQITSNYKQLAVGKFIKN